MSYEELLNARRIRRETISADEVEAAMQRAQRDLKTARHIMPEDWDWGFAIAYDAVLQASRAYMFSRGFRPASAEGHKNVFAFMHEALGGEYDDVVAYFDRMRVKRNRAIYDVAGLITAKEAEGLFARACDFVALIRDRLGSD